MSVRVIRVFHPVHVVQEVRANRHYQKPRPDLDIHRRPVALFGPAFRDSLVVPAYRSVRDIRLALIPQHVHSLP